MITQFLVWLSYLSPCHKAEITYDLGYDQTYCTKCGITI
jgi:hypothetical protein